MNRAEGCLLKRTSDKLIQTSEKLSNLEKRLPM
jgi:hypothetical protein